LKAEIQRVAEHTEFNGTKLLDGSFSKASFQIGANQGQIITVDKIANADISKLGGTWKLAGNEKVATSAAVTITDPAQKIAFKVGGVEIEVAAAESGKTRTADEAMAALHAAFDAAKKADASKGALKNIEFGGDNKLTSSADLKIETATNLGGIKAETVKASDSVEGFAGQSVLTAKASDNMILAMDAALNSVNSTRAELGAIQNRFTSVVANLNSTSENLSASRSRIRDTDYAKETSELTRTQILQQAGTAMLAQAKSMPQSVLSLLQ